MMILLKFSNWDVKPWMVFMDSVIMTLKATSVSEPVVAFSTWNHGYSEGNSRVGDSIL